ncbi:MAG: type I restriction-modification system subunit M N-terminal domain-containing protein [Rhodoferax sp.]|uniref:type I restriction enzyme subunit R domain-containing protein n=1 Tax=Rhodoferax sp. TaxID=50421 RepID=UPI003BB60A30
MPRVLAHAAELPSCQVGEDARDSRRKSDGESTQQENDSSAHLGFKAKLWLTADKLRNNMDAAKYKHVVLGLTFLTYISDTFEEHRAKLLAGQLFYSTQIPVCLWFVTKDDDAEAEKGKACVVKVVMTGSAGDGPDWQPHIRSKDRRRKLAKRFRDASDPFRIVIVRDMWLTGFDAPCLHTMYADKPMQGHGLMQAIARVNRVFRDKPGGLMVD